MFVVIAFNLLSLPTPTFAQGLGDSGYGWKPVADQLSRDPSFQHVKWVLPHA